MVKITIWTKVIPNNKSLSMSNHHNTHRSLKSTNLKGIPSIMMSITWTIRKEQEPYRGKLRTKNIRNPLIKVTRSRKSLPLNKSRNHYLSDTSLVPPQNNTTKKERIFMVINITIQRNTEVTINNIMVLHLIRNANLKVCNQSFTVKIRHINRSKDKFRRKRIKYAGKILDKWKKCQL